MIKLPENIINEVTCGSFGFDEIEYKICDPESKWYDKFSFHDKLFIISKIFNLFDSENDWDRFENRFAFIDKKEFFSIVQKLNGMQFSYDGDVEDMAILRDILNTIKGYSKEISYKFNGQKREGVFYYAISPYFFCTIFHCFAPQTVFAVNNQLLAKSLFFYDSDETLLHYDEVVPDDFKNRLKKLYEENRSNLFSLPDCDNLRKFMPRKLFSYYLRAYTLCQAIVSTRWGDFNPDLPYPVTIRKIFDITGRVRKNYNDECQSENQ